MYYCSRIGKIALFKFFTLIALAAGQEDVQNVNVNELVLPLSATITGRASPLWIDNQSFIYCFVDRINLVNVCDVDNIELVWQTENDAEVDSIDYFEGTLLIFTSDGLLTMLSLPSKQVVGRIKIERDAMEPFALMSSYFSFKVITNKNLLLVERSNQIGSLIKTLLGNKKQFEFSHVEVPPTLFYGLSHRRRYFICLSRQADSIRITNLSEKKSSYFPTDSEKKWNEKGLMGNDISHFGRAFYDEDRDILIFDTFNYWAKKNEIDIVEVYGTKKFCWELKNKQKLLEVNFHRDLIFCSDFGGTTINIFNFSAQEVFSYTNETKHAPKIIKVSPGGDRILMCDDEILRILFLKSIPD